METYTVINYHNLNKSTIRHIKVFYYTFSLGVSMVKQILKYRYVLTNKLLDEKIQDKILNEIYLY